MAKLPVVQTPTKLRVVQLKTKKQKQKQTKIKYPSRFPERGK